MAKLLLVDDDKKLVEALAYILSEQQHHVVDFAHTGEEALISLRSLVYDAVILDWNMPPPCGLDVIKAYRAEGGRIPILMLTCRDEYTDKILALDAGADDYLTKPFHPKELCARVRALLRRPQLTTPPVLRAGNLQLNPVEFTVTKGGKDVPLARMEFALLEFLVRHPNEVFSPQTLLDRVWPADSSRSPESLRVLIKKLREKIDDDEPTQIKNVHGVGYKLDTPMCLVAPPAPESFMRRSAG